MKTYLDYNATAPMRPQAIAKMQEWLYVPANPSSVHSFGRDAKKCLEDARKTIAEAISAWQNEVIFTASGTEANVTALNSFPEHRLLVSAVEHPSIIAYIPSICHPREGGDLKLKIPAFAGMTNSIIYDDKITVDASGVISLADLEAKLAKSQHPALISVMLANNETGVIQPIKEIAEICKKHNALLHCDAVQALGKIVVDFSLLGVDMLTISAHKCGGAVGAAALIVKNNLAIKPLLTGGGQELGRRAGTENIATIAAFSCAVQEIDFSHMRNLRCWLDAMETELEQAGGIIIGKTAQRLPNTTNIAMQNIDNQLQLMNFDLAGFAVSAGSACSSGRVQTSHVLLAMGIQPEIANAAIRISGGWNSTREEIQKFTQEWLRLKNRL